MTPADVAAMPGTPPKTSWNRLWLAADALNKLKAERGGAVIERKNGRRPLSLRRKRAINALTNTLAKEIKTLEFDLSDHEQFVEAVRDDPPAIKERFAIADQKTRIAILEEIAKRARMLEALKVPLAPSSNDEDFAFDPVNPSHSDIASLHWIFVEMLGGTPKYSKKGDPIDWIEAAILLVGWSKKSRSIAGSLDIHYYRQKHERPQPDSAVADLFTAIYRESMIRDLEQA